MAKCHSVMWRYPTYSDKWRKNTVYDRLTNEKLHIPKSEIDQTKVYDHQRAYNLAYALRADGITLGKIAEKLNKEGLRPPLSLVLINGLA